MIEKGSIVEVMQDIYIEFPGGAYRDHFVRKPVLLLVKTDETNNGNMLCVNSKGYLYHVNHRDIVNIRK